MGFAGAQDLKTADVPANSPELLDIGKKKVRALIGRNAPRKANLSCRKSSEQGSRNSFAFDLG